MPDKNARISGMEIVEFRPGPEQYAYTFGGVAPLRKVRPGTALRLWTDDAFGGALRSTGDLPSEKLTMPFVNPQTGPFYVEGAEPGDALALHFVSLTPARSWGASSTIPFFGGLTSTDRTVTLQDPLPERTWIYEVDSDKQTVGFQAASTDMQVDLPINTMLGTVGVAPAAGEARSSLVPDAFGGNMDTPEMRAGVTCYLPVNVEGALFSVGDGHYRQGEGEACGTAVEGAMDVTLIVDLVKGAAPSWPRIESDDYLTVVGSSRPLEDAWRISQGEMVSWLRGLYGLDALDAYQLLSQVSESPLANVVDANYSAVAKVRKALLPAATAFGGIHAHLRELGSGL
jgi:acetamidase/formamidase